ncbi:hypothetical protein ADK57_17675 [Streptomyces sp. MMG1533]|uniref:hypothetical protein n=1 Tax=Streptomyces sp. MMG1533 TaxID=1415546 RepID=UPI0006AEC2E2|nr:hypothetical protein [Streptomyces sp. MMG1533]KOU66815.1 hypothetical protein ADK57_17675 [Streptomyces sp. MMG1533]
MKIIAVVGCTLVLTRLEYELRRSTVEMAHAEGEATAKCPGNLASSKPTKATCITTNNGWAAESGPRV